MPQRKEHRTNKKWYTHISQLPQFMSPPETYNREIGSQNTMFQVHQNTMFQVHAGVHVSLLASPQGAISR